MIKKLTILFLSHIVLFYLSQTKPPESYSLIRGVNENINLNSGIVDLNIPLFEVTEGHLKLSNVLNYESQGFVPHITPSYVGLNWKMIQFGKITRESHRIDFTMSNTPLLFRPAAGSELNTIATNPRNYYRNDCIDVGFRPIGGKYSYKKNIFNNPFEKDYYASIYYPDLPGGPFLGGYAGKSYDFEPDKFYFDFMGYKGYFIVDNERKPIVYCENAALKVDITNYGYHDIFGNITFSQFTIIDDKGNKFFFGGNPDTLDINYSFNRVNLTDAMFYVPNIISVDNNANKTNYIDSWSLTKVELQNGIIINAHYKHGDITILNDFRGFNPKIELPKINNMVSFIPYYDAIGFPDKQALKNNNLVVNHVRQFTDTDARNGGMLGSQGRAFKHVQIDTYTKRAILDSITSNDITIGYEYVDSNNPLELTNNYLDKINLKRKNKLIKQVNFTYENLGKSNQRTFLKKIVSTGNEEILFDYYKTDNFPPYKNSYYLTNELGFWNGITDPEPNFDYYVDYYLPDDLDKFNVGILQKVTYPTKGSTTYFYENGDYSYIYKYNDLNDPEYLTVASENKIVNAPRIYKKIVNNLTNTPVETIYKYKNDDNSSSGIIDGVLFFIPNASYGGTLAKKNISPNLLSQNSLHYSNITESIQQKGFTKYKFTDRLTNPDIFTNKVMKNPIEPPGCRPTWYKRDEVLLSKQNERGKLLKQEIYNNNNIKLKETTYEYNNFLNKFPNLDIADGCSNCKISDLNYYIKTISTATPGEPCFIQTIYVPVVPYLQTSQITKEYFEDKVIEMKKELIYNQSSNNWHPYPIQESFTTPQGTAIKKYLYPTDFNNPACWGGRTCPNDNDIVGAQWKTYREMVASNLFVPVLEISKNENNKFSLKENFYTSGISFLYSLKKVRHSLLNATIDFSNYSIPSTDTADDINYDIHDNKANVLQTTTENGVPVTTIYGYNQTLPIAVITGIGYERLMEVFGLTKNSTSYLSLDIVSKSDADRDAASEYLLLNALDIFRKNPALSNYQITTYTYNPLIGVTSITPSSGIRENYVYNTANQLERIVDINGKVLKEYKYNYKN